MPAAPLLLTTKLYLPAARQNLVQRPRLLARLAEGFTRPLTLISAPAGFGKTTLISEWHASEGGQDFPLAWLALDDDDNDPAHFLTYFIAALATLKPGFGETILALLKSPQPAPPKLILTHLINEVNLWPAPFALVLDDYHVINSPSIHEAVAFLLDHLPPPMHIIITTRTDPPLPLARWRARQQLVEIRSDELRFTPAETAAFLHQVMGLNLSPADVAVLETRTEGWAAGLQMAALSMQGRRDLTSFINQFSGSHRYILDYLMDEVLQHQPQAIQEFLLQTSILNHLSGPLCNAVMDRTDSQAILERLEQANLFLLPLDDERRWYRYHHLFAEALRHRQQNLHPEHAAILHRRASEWHEQHGLIAAAIHHSLSAPDFERAAYLVEQVGQELLIRSETVTLLKWLTVLPEELILTRPYLCLFHAWTLILNNQVTEAEQRLQAASALEADPVVLAQVAAIRTLVALFRGDMRHANELTRQAQALLPAGDPFLRGVTNLNRGLACFMKGDVEAARQAYAEVAELSQKSGNVMVTVIIQCQIAEAQMWQGRLHQALATYQQALALATTPEGYELPGAAQAHIGLATVMYEWNNLEAAAQHLAEGFRLNRQLGEIGAYDGYIIETSLKQAQGDAAGALEAIEQAGLIVQKFSQWAYRNLAAHRTRLWLRQANLIAAARWAADTLNIPAGTPDDLGDTYLFHEFEQLTLARVLLAQASAGLPADQAISGDPAQAALQLLEALYPEAVKLGRGRSVIEILLLQALAQQANGDTFQAMSRLQQALTLAQTEGFVRIFVDNGPPLEKLLRQAAVRGIMVDYVDKLLAAFDTRERQVTRPPARPSPSALIEPLSEREVEVLRFLAAGLSNEAIANRLIITVSTVKKHLSTIYGKLDVHSRTAAVARARELDIL
ncbi:MAG: tetratricopeptide repeat protein [Anaerolineae bacterium]|nr:tetratricopeptide repeat protein [Anaerolineae bacterium]